VTTGAAVLFGASVALGAFLAGMVVAQSPVSQQAGIDALPMRDAFAVLFFVAVGMLLDPAFLVQDPLLVLAGLSIVMAAKPLAALLIVMVLGYPLRTAMTVAIALAQIGEFSFIVGNLALKLDLLPQAGMNVLVASAIVSITLNPFLFRLIDPIEHRLRKAPRLWRLLNHRADRRARALNLEGKRRIRALDEKLAIVVGYGPVGQQVDRLLREAGVQTVIVDLNIDTVTRLASEGRAAVFGDATRSELLEQAGIKRASYLLLTAPHTSNYHMLVPEVRRLNPQVRIVVRTRYLREAEAFHQVDIGTTVVDEVESAAALTELVLREMDTDSTRIPLEIDRLRKSMARNKD
jgi:CPA2 family monovalent cation:H+ antiporter-2